MPIYTYEKARRVLLLSQGKVTLWILLVCSVFGLSEAYVTCALGKEMVILPFLEINTIKRQKKQKQKQIHLSQGDICTLNSLLRLLAQQRNSANVLINLWPSNSKGEIIHFGHLFFVSCWDLSCYDGAFNDPACTTMRIQLRKRILPNLS